MISNWFQNKNIRNILLLWIFWAVVIIGFQYTVKARMKLLGPDKTVYWSEYCTPPNISDDSKRFVLRNQVAWDSFYYVSISLAGYDDPTSYKPVIDSSGKSISLNYAFFPFYPVLMKLFSIPFTIFGAARVDAAAFAGVLISLLGTLAALFALYTILKKEIDGDSATRAGYYLLIFPSGFFLAQVYTEGLFIGLAFSCLAFLYYRKFLPAALLALLAVWTKAAGVMLVIPYIWTLLSGLNFKGDKKKILSLENIMNSLLVLLPLIGFCALYFSSFGMNFSLVEAKFFKRYIDFGRAFRMWSRAIALLPVSLPETIVYYLIEAGGFILAFTSCIAIIKKYTAIALFSLLALFLPVITGEAQSVIRYVLILPAVYIFLAKMGENKVFHQVWPLISILLMGMLTILFTFKMWVA